jgi:hypothetical protein
MPTIERTLKVLEQRFLTVQVLRAQQNELKIESFFDEAEYYARRKKFDDEIRAANLELREALERYEREPERHYLRHSDKLGEFFKVGGFEESVFIMTKFPDPGDPQAQKLQTVIDTVVSGIHDRQYKPRIASDAIHHRWLWDNVEIYLLGCARGIAIVEDKYLPELNPNVALEWGWMEGMGRSVLYLREEEFKHDRADWTGLITSRFDWNDPAPGVHAALDAFLPKRS